MRPVVLPFLSVIAMLVLVRAAVANPITIERPFMNLENDGVNSDGFSTGQFLRIGATSVQPTGALGTTGYGSTLDLVTGSTVNRTLYFVPSPLNPGFFERYLTAASNASLYGPWTLNFTNGADHAQAVVSLPAGQQQAPFVNSVTLSGTGAAPTFTWAAPTSGYVNGYRINIYDKTLIRGTPGHITNSGQVASVSLQPEQTSFTVTPSDFTVPGNGLVSGHQYSIEINVVETKDGTSTNLGNRNLAAIARTYADFTPTSGTSPTVNLPVTLSNGSFLFNFAVAAGQTYYIDPTVAVGYDYRIGAGDPNFASVVLPTDVGNGRYDIYGIGSGGQATLLAHNWAGGTVFDFAGTGVADFRVTGIETSAGLDPTSGTAFVSGLTFEGAGLFTGTQTPLTATVPEPGVPAMLGLGLALLAFERRRVGRR